MPANLPPQYYEVERKLKEAKSNFEKILLYEELLSIMPKHKGTDKLQADLRRRIAKLREEQKEKKEQKRVDSFYIEKEGAGQIAIIGSENVGKSSLLSKLTNARPQVASYPFTTKKPIPGMMPFKNIKIQLIDTPAMSKEYTESGLMGIIQRADAIVLVVDLGKENIFENVNFILERLLNSRTKLINYKEKLIQKPGFLQKPCLIIGNKSDLDTTKEREKILRDLYKEQFEIITTSYLSDDTEILKQKLFELLDIIRVYTKVPNKEPDLEVPYTLKGGITLIEFAGIVHKDFLEKLKFARVWGKSKLNGQRVQKDYILQDEDIVELHI